MLLRNMTMMLALVPLMALAATDTLRAECDAAGAAIDRLQALTTAESAARDALATIRRNAQDWKNLLLRGGDPSQRQVMQSRFDAQAGTYQMRLSQLRTQLTPLGLAVDRVDTLESERATLFERYRMALERHGVSSLEAAAAADRDVQGADVATFRTLEQLIDVVAGQTEAQFGNLRAAIAACTSNK